VPDVVAVAGDNLESSIAFSVTYDKNVVEPRYFLLYKGYSISATYEIAGLGGDVHFGKVTVDANWQTTLLEFPTDHKWVLQLVGGFGYMNNYQDRETPIFERFFAGGPHTIRGFAYRGVGPMFFSKPLGGNVRLNGTAELSFPLFLHIVRGVVFLDACDLETSFHDVHAGGIRLAAGTGVRISLPIFPAPIALDFGWPILKEREDKTQVFSFSVGVGF